MPATPAVPAVEARPKAPPWQRPFGVSDVDPYAPDSVAVYRFYNVPGALLYVGITGNPKNRFGNHHGDKPWWPGVSHWTVEWHPDRATADAEETQAIRDEFPAYNIAKVPAPEDERNPAAEWIATFRRRQPRKVDLDDLFLVLVRLRSLGHDPKVRRAWTERKALDIYVYAKDHAPRIDVHEHQRFIEQWNAEQEVAWRKHHGEPEPEMVPGWPRLETARERFAMWLLDRSVPRLPRRSQGPREIKFRERAAQTKVRCTETNILIVVCDCHTLHVVDAADEAKFGRPIGWPLGRRIRKPQVAVMVGSSA